MIPKLELHKIIIAGIISYLSREGIFTHDMQYKLKVEKFLQNNNTLLASLDNETKTRVINGLNYVLGFSVEEVFNGNNIPNQLTS